MKTFETQYNQAIQLLESALNKYKTGNVEIAHRLRKQANEALDTLLTESTNDIVKSNMLYGTGRNFGIIYNVFENNVLNKENNANVKKALKECVHLIKNNKVLSEQFKVYNALTNNKHLSGNVNEYINNVLSVTQPLSESQMIEENDKLIGVIRKYKLNEAIDLDTDKLQFFESIHNLLRYNKNMSNLKDVNIVSESKQIIAEAIDNNLSAKDTESEYQSELDKLEEKYNQILTDEEKQFIEEVTTCSNKQELFEQYKSELLKCISDKLQTINEDDLRSKWLLLNEKIEKSNYDAKTYIVDIAKMVDIYNQLQ